MEHTSALRLCFKNIFVLLFFLFVTVLQAQNQNDTVKGYNKASIKIADPKSIIEAYSYDPVSDRYIYTKSFEGFTIDYPLVLTPAEYQKLVTKESIKKYFKEKSDAVAGQKSASKDAKKDLLPKYHINSAFFESIFGSNTIEIKPTGTVEVDLGLRHTRQDNPSFSPRNRANTTFDFDQRISLSLLGKVGTRLKINTNYDTQSTFAFQNLIKLEYAPTEDDILQKIEVGNVSMPLNSSLVRGVQSLFGVKTQLQFGKTTVTGVFSEQKSQTKTITSQGGGLVQNFELFGLDYDSDRHFFLSQYFRNRYDKALENYPIIDSRIQITRLEVWVTNRQNRINTTPEGNNLRNIIALQDLAEAQQTAIPDTDIIGIPAIPTNFFRNPIGSPADNSNNNFDPKKIGDPINSNLTQAIREVSSSANLIFTGLAATPSEGSDYSKLENARKLTSNEFTFHPQLGYLSLNQRLTNDEVLAVAYQYTIGDQVYQVGEFGTDGVTATKIESDIPTSQALIVKMLKGNLTNVNKPVWNLMMKNIYQIPGAYQLDRSDFKFNLLYNDPSPLNYIELTNPKPAQDFVTNTPLLKVFNLDKLNANNDPQNGGDGFFDFLPGITIDVHNARIIFTKIEPFGSHLFEKLRSDPSEDYNAPLTNYNTNQKKYVFRNLYKKTQAQALQESEKNKFQLKGKFKSSGGDGISLGAANVPKGSVVVTAGGRVLQEGIDYSVNYQAGRVQILDPSLQASGVPIQVSVENNAIFGQQTRRFIGLNVEHKFSDKLQIGASVLNMSERPYTQKTNYGQESVNNTIFGTNANYSTEVPFLTRMVNKLPNIDTDAPSNLALKGEIAYLKPGTPTADRFNGESTVYVDDFEGSQSAIDMKSPFAWSLASVPSVFDANIPTDPLSYGYKRAKLSWYTIDPTFYTSQRPADVNDDDISKYATRRIYTQELFPNTDIAPGESTVVPTLNLTYYPKERGPYNFNPLATNNSLPTTQNNFAGIMRSIASTNFEQANVEYIQFWMLDPYVENTGKANSTNTGKLTLHLGEISEDILKDGRKLYENGLPTTTANQAVIGTSWGKVPASQSLIYAFDTDQANRDKQDVGLNGLDDTEENAKFPLFAGEDPAQDNYQYFLAAQGSITDRYKKYNGLEGNSPVDVTNTNRGSVTTPDVEDINRDNTMNTIEAYYKFSIDVKPNLKVGDLYVSDIRETTSTPMPNGTTTPVRWIQFKIPIDINGPKEGDISDLRSIRFMRMLVHGFNEEITLRLGSLDLVRGEWRRYNSSLQSPVGTIPVNDDPTDDPTGFDVQAVNIQENSNRSPIRYVIPPGVQREQLYNNNAVINQNEQSLALRVYDNTNNQTGTNGLEAGDSRATFKNVSVDMRQYKKMRMFLHAESLGAYSSTDLKDNQMHAFIRFGNDFTDNFYQVEIPLKVTPHGATGASEIWPNENELDLDIDLLTELKIKSLNQATAGQKDANGILFADATSLNPSAKTGMRIGVKGNPNFGYLRTLMVGVKNASNNQNEHLRGEVWFNELRLSGVDNKGGMAAIASLDANLADFMTLSATGRMNTIGFGTLEQSPNERSRENAKQYNLVTNINLGKLLPKKWGVNLPFNYATGQEVITPQYDPFNQDIKLQQLLDVTTDTNEKAAIQKRSEQFTKRSSINFIGVKKERAPKQVSHFFDPENVTVSYSFNQVEHRDFEIENMTDQQLRTSADYNYTFKPKPVEVLKNVSFLKKSNYWKLLSDFNFNYLPTNLNFSTTILRQYNKQQFRQIDIQGIALDPLYKRNYMFNYNYGFSYNLTKAMRFNYTATTGNLVRNYLDDNNNPIPDFSIWDDYWNIGTPNNHAQQITMNYELPINKIPFLAFIKSDYTYTGDYSWNRGSIAAQNFKASDGNVYNLGNTLQNANTNKWNASFDMATLYKYIGLVKKADKKSVPAPTTAIAPPKPGQKIVAIAKPQVIKTNLFIDGLVGVATSIKRLQINYSQTNGTMLPGYLPSIGFLGSSRPSLGFVFGMQDDVRFEAAKKGWLTNYPEFNQNFTQISNDQITATANLEPFNDLKIDLTADRTIAHNFSEQFDAVGQRYNSHSPYDFGNFSISTLMIGNSFAKNEDDFSASFEQFRNNRLIIANRLASQKGIDTSVAANLDQDGFPKGYNKNNQAVLLPAFLAAYTSDFNTATNIPLNAIRSFPIPNWNIKYTGLMRYEFFKQNFKRFSVQHAYKAAYTLNSFRSNFDYDKNPNGTDPISGNYYNKTIIGNVNLSEQFNPLVRLDFEMKNSVKILAEMKKDRTLSLSFDNNLLTEIKGLEYVIGLGYRIKDVQFTSRLAESASKVIKGDINLRGDLSFRNNKTIVRNLDYNNNQLGGGQNLISASIKGDYTFSKNVTALFYFDYTFSRAVISTAFPMTNIRSGFTLRYNFGN